MRIRSQSSFKFKKRAIVRMALGCLPFCMFLGCASLAPERNSEQQKRAIIEYQEELRKDPENVQAGKEIGIAYYKIGDIDKALRALENVVEKRPDDPEARYYLGVSRLRNGQVKPAISQLQAYGELMTDSAEAEVSRQITLLRFYDALRFSKEVIGKEKKFITGEPLRNSVAVFPYRDHSQDGRFQDFGRALSSMVITDLSRVQFLTVVERLRVQFLLDELEMGKEEIFDESTVPRPGRMLGAENLIVGTLHPGSISVETGVVSTSLKAMHNAFSLSMTPSNFFEIQKVVVFNLLKVLDIKLKASELKIIESYHTTSFRAATYYGRALGFQDNGEWKEARSFYRKALEIDPMFWLALRGLASCPYEDAPTLERLVQMTPEEVALIIEEALSPQTDNQTGSQKTRSIGRDESSGGEQHGIGDSSGGEATERGTGGIDVRW